MILFCYFWNPIATDPIFFFFIADHILTKSLMKIRNKQIPFVLILSDSSI